MKMRRIKGARASRYVHDANSGTFHISPRERLLERDPPTVPPFEALRDIHHKLAVRTELFENHGDGGRAGIYFAILDVCHFFESRGIPIAALAPLQAVAAAIADADRGVSSPIFKPDRQSHGGKPAKSIIQLTREGHLAAVTELCIRHCKAEGHRPFVEPGCALAQSLIRKSDWPEDPTRTELRELRERVLSTSKSSPDRVAFDSLMSLKSADTHMLKLAEAITRNELVPTPPA